MHSKLGAGSQKVGRGFRPHEERNKDAAVGTIAQSFQRVSQDAGQEKGGKKTQKNTSFLQHWVWGRVWVRADAPVKSNICVALNLFNSYTFPNDKSHSFM